MPLKITKLPPHNADKNNINKNFLRSLFLTSKIKTLVQRG